MERGDPEKILPIPEGEPMFMFCMIRGKSRSLRSFLDGGCSSWLAKDGVPQKELKSCKLRDGPIGMYVAGGHVATADAEWSSTIPLADGNSQTVRGLTVKNVTSRLGDIDMSSIMKEIRKAANKSDSPGRKTALKLRAPEVVSGEVDMLIGIKYNSVFPEPVFTTPEGLTLYKSKFLAPKDGELGCVGGRTKGLQ